MPLVGNLHQSRFVIRELICVIGYATFKICLVKPAHTTRIRRNVRRNEFGLVQNDLIGFEIRYKCHLTAREIRNTDNC